MKWLILSLLCATSSCASAPAPARAGAYSVSAPTAPFARYRTFSFGNAGPPRSGYELSPHSLAVQERLVPLVAAAFAERGYVKSAEGGDFVVKLASGTMPGRPPGDSPEGERDVGTAPQGFIGIDVYDGTSGIEVWQGTAFAEIAMDKIDEGLLARGVARMLATFPQQSGSVPTERHASATRAEAQPE